ncbi:MAG TPA: SPOR domain-containing protein [Telluria sp.]|nr:SPOR domain-containing protein [Telluria sp.]
MNKSQRGNIVVGIIIGVVIGLGIALAVAVYVTKVPVPFLNRGMSRSPEQDAAESRKNRDWDPNAPLYGKNPAKALPPAQGPASGAVAPAQPPVTATPVPEAPATAKSKSNDPLGDFAAARAGKSANDDPFFYFVQAGAFRTPEDAEAQRAKLSLMGIDAKVTEREQSGRQVFRVRIGPFDRKEEADRQKEKLDAGGFDTALVRVQR